MPEETLHPSTRSDARTRRIGAICQTLHAGLRRSPFRHDTSAVQHASNVTARCRHTDTRLSREDMDVVHSAGLAAVLRIATAVLSKQGDVHSSPHLWIFLLRGHGNSVQIRNARSWMKHLDMGLGLDVVR